MQAAAPDLGLPRPLSPLSRRDRPRAPSAIPPAIEVSKAEKLPELEQVRAKIEQVKAEGRASYRANFREVVRLEIMVDHLAAGLSPNRGEPSEPSPEA